MIQPRKDDSGKLDLTILFEGLPDAILATADVLDWAVTRKEHPYPAHNWRGVDVNRFRAALMRHLMAYFADHDSRDDESGLLHLQHAASNILIILQKHLDHDKANEGPRVFGQQTQSPVPGSDSGKDRWGEDEDYGFPVGRLVR